MAIFIWIGIIGCLCHSALFSGLNLGFFGLSRLRLEVEAELKNKDAQRILELRRESHFLLTTILWGNVMSNVLLALLTESILAGVGAFIFSSFFYYSSSRNTPASIFLKAYFKAKFRPHSFC